MNWVKGMPTINGRYLAANHEAVGEARFKARKGEWIFPHAAMRFEPTHWGFLPDPPPLNAGGDA